MYLSIYSVVKRAFNDPWLVRNSGRVRIACYLLRLDTEEQIGHVHTEEGGTSITYVWNCNVRGRGSLSHYLVYSESPSRWCSLAIILLIYLHHNLLLVSNRSIQTPTG
jgi:hypothetical protein